MLGVREATLLSLQEANLSSGGVGGPAREISRFSGCNVIGINNNAYQISRAERHTTAAGLEKQVSFVKGNFMESKEPTAFPCCSRDC